MKISDLIREYAKEHGYTGLCGNECGCDIDDDICVLESGNLTECEFGYRNECYLCAKRDTCEDWDGDYDILYFTERCFVPVADAATESQEVPK